MNAAQKDYILSAPRRERESFRKIRTFTGRYVNPLEMRAADVNIVDIAHALANLCRYTGHCPQHYSVAQHSVDVSMRIARVMPDNYALQMAGLLHDAGEAYFNDIASPVKSDPRMQWYKDAEHETTRLIFCVFGLNPDLLQHVKTYDDDAFLAEAKSFWNKNEEPTIFPYRVIAGTKRQFLLRFEQLKRQL